METKILTKEDLNDKNEYNSDSFEFTGNLYIPKELGTVTFRGFVQVTGYIKAGMGIEAGYGITAGLGITAGKGIKAGWGIIAGTGITAERIEGKVYSGVVKLRK